MRELPYMQMFSCCCLHGRYIFATVWPAVRNGKFAMNCHPSQTASRSVAFPERERIRSQLLSRLEKQGCELPSNSGPTSQRDAALATALMDCYRQTRDSEVFEGLVRWVNPQLRARVRARMRSLGAMHDPSEVLQDTIVNIYRYPDRFVGSRPGAFWAW